MLPLFFWDLDGPLLDVSFRYYRVYSDLLTEHGWKPVSLNRYWEAKRQHLPDRKILAWSDCPEDWTDDYQRLRRGLIEDARYLGHDQVWQGVRSVLASASERTDQYLVTMRLARPALEQQIRKLRLFKYFTSILSAEEDAGGPARAMAKADLIRSNIAGEISQSWMIGDTETDVRAGKQLGLRTAAVSFGIRVPELLEVEHPDVILRTPAEVAVWLRAELDADAYR